MTREEAKCIIQNMLDDAEKYGDIDYDNLNDFISACKVTIEVLSDVPDISVGKWIPCSERLPKSCGTYIVSRWFGDGIEKRILTDACHFDGSDVWYDDTRVNHGREYVTDKIVAWMPLPKPYKGEKE